LSLAKCQAQMAMDKASKSCDLTKQMSILEDNVSGLAARVVHLEECDSFFVGIVEFACELLRCKVSCDFLLFPFYSNTTCLDFVGETRRISEWITALERSSEGVESFWSDPWRRCAIVLLQDRAQHIGEAVDGCRRSLTTMHSVMLPRNPLPGTFPQLLAAFRSTQRIH
jgi:hypothetical protein